MTDFTWQNLTNLRSRIAAVHQAHRWGVFRCDDIAAAIRAVDDMRVCKLHDADIKFITEAVIRELGPELNRHNTGCVCDDCWGDEHA